MNNPINYNIGKIIDTLRNPYLRYAILIFGSLALLMSYENLVLNFIHDAIHPFMLTRTFQTVLFFSIFWIFCKKNSSLIYKCVALLVTLIIFNLAVYLAVPTHNMIKVFINELSLIPEFTSYLGIDFINLVNNKYFGYSSSFLACLGIVRFIIYNFLNSIFIKILLDPTEYIYTCKCCNGIVNKTKD